MYSPTEDLPGHSRIWIYQCSRELTSPELVSIADEAKLFLESWTAHNQSLKAGYEIRYSRFLILMIDEKTAGASGCSIDKSVHFIKSLEKKYEVAFLDRMQFAYKINDKVETVAAGAFESLFSNGQLTKDSIVFNNLIQTKGELDSAWEISLMDSWHKDLIRS
jgi:hypothetical protein